VASGDAPVDGQPAHGTAGRGGFVRFPGAVFSADPGSLGSYNWAASRWLPVLRAWASPDGARYAWPEYRVGPGPVTGIIHVVDVASGADRTVGLPASATPIDFASEGVYTVHVIPNSDGASAGLTLVDPAGSFRQIVPDGLWQHIGGGFAFGADVDKSSQALPVGTRPANRVRRLDLATGAATTYDSEPGREVQILGVQGADPVLAITDGASYTVKVAGAVLYSGPVGAANPSAPVVADAGTIWLGSQAGAIWRSDGGAAAREVGMTGLVGVQVAGTCR
jgi:hypothetical protein